MALRPPERGRVAIVGVCTSGKTTLRDGLVRSGYDAYTVAQEHSSIRRMWSLARPGFLIYLHCELEEIKRRRAVYWGNELYQRQIARLEDARQNCNVYIDTTNLTIEQTLKRALCALEFGTGGGKSEHSNNRDPKEAT